MVIKRVSACPISCNDNPISNFLFSEAMFGSYTRAYIVYLVLNIRSKSVRVGAKDIFPISRNTFDKIKPVKYM